MGNINKGHLIISIKSMIKVHKDEIRRLENLLDMTSEVCDINGVPDDNGNKDIDAVKKILNDHNLDTFIKYNEWLMSHPSRKSLIADKVSATASRNYSFVQVDKIVREVLE